MEKCSVNSKVVGSIAAKTQPVVKQVFIGKNNTNYQILSLILNYILLEKLLKTKFTIVLLHQKNYFYFSSLTQSNFNLQRAS